MIEREKNWCQALQYCRNDNTDLVSIANETQNEAVIEMGRNKSFWIGLMHDEWEWVDKSCSSFRKWTEKQPKDMAECTFYDGYSVNITLSSSECNGQTRNSLCSQGKVRIKVIKQRLNWEEAYDYCKAHHTGLLWIQDSKDEKAVQQWLNHTDVTGPFWIGLRQSQVFGFWIWTSDRIVTNNNWENGTQPELPLSNHCGVIKNNFKWSDENCLFQLPFLCEEEIVYMNK
ncbi:C-type mannose receptor 2-like [Morone saxatilis]|uniref:C-type mannose receptor 2-like n=1 Tax=Morone saxatilis TaxID=34816 RepID=UPI0015E1F11A|nr:C-type mannose receptor 2-like [Morone saxatilis]